MSFFDRDKEEINREKGMKKVKEILEKETHDMEFVYLYYINFIFLFYFKF
jgi:hypothetical protein